MLISQHLLNRVVILSSLITAHTTNQKTFWEKPGRLKQIGPPVKLKSSFCNLAICQNFRLGTRVWPPNDESLDHHLSSRLSYGSRDLAPFRSIQRIGRGGTLIYVSCANINGPQWTLLFYQWTFILWRNRNVFPIFENSFGWFF